MEKFLGYYLLPHPPIIIPEVGRGEEEKIAKTTEAFKRVAKEVKEKTPETIIEITPHGPVFSDAIAISFDDEISGNLERFQAKQVSINKKIDKELTNEIVTLANDANIPVVEVNNDLLTNYQRKFELDHGCIVPLYFIEKEYKDYKLVHITYGLLKDIDLFRFGMMIKQAVKNLNRKTVLIASGDLSHRLTIDGPYDYSPKGKEFDETLVSNLENGDSLNVFKMNKQTIEEAGECGMRSIYTLLGAINSNFKGNLLSYEGPFGVGYAVMNFEVLDTNIDILPLLEKSEKNRIINKIENSDEYVKLARNSLSYFFKNKQEMEVPKDIAPELINNKAGVFVSLKKYGNLRGCVGTFLPVTNSIAEEIIRNAIEAAIEDPRFNPVSATELNELDISVDVLSKPVQASKHELDPKIYGVIVSSGYKKGLLLPNLEGIDSVEEQLNIACNKAGISPKSKYEIQKFTVERHLEGEDDGTS